MKKLWSTVLVLCMLAGLAACGGGSDSTTPANTTAPANETSSAGVTEAPKMDVTISIMHFWVNADSAIKEIAAQFYEETGITVEVYNSNVATHLTDLNERVQSGDVPEIFTMWPGASMAPYIDSKVVADLGGSEWVSRMQAFAEEACTTDGTLYLAPVNTTYLTLAYNKDVFDRLGLEVPQNQEDFETILETLKADSQIETPFINGSDFLLNLSSAMFTSDIYQKIPDFDAQVTNKTKAFNGPEVFEIYKKMLIEWPAKGYINADTALATDRMGRAVLDFVDGKAAIMSLGSYDLEVLKQVNTANVPIEMFPYPAADNHGSLLAAAGEAFSLSAAASGDQKEAAVQFLNYLMKPENNAKICESINSLSALNDVTVNADSTITALQAYNDQPTHGWMVWPMEVQNNLKNLGDVLTAAEADKETVLQQKLDELQAAWEMQIQ